MDALRQDLRLACRALAKSPGFTLAAVATLALGLAANATTFAFMNALLLRPFPLLDQERLVSVWEVHPQEGSPGGPLRSGDQNPLAVADYLDLDRERPGVESVAAYRYRDFVVTEAGEPERVPGYLVTPGYFETLGLRPAMGRTFRTEEGTPGRDLVVILGHEFWQRRFAGDPAALGKAFDLEGQRHVVVGVLPAGANFPPGAPDVFVPLAFSEGERSERGTLSLLAVGRLRGERAAAQATVDGFSARLARTYPETNSVRTLSLVPLREMQTGLTAPFLLLFEGGATFVLLIACANVAGLLLARGAGREREIALRAALGAGRGRIVRLLLTEGLVLSMLGAAAALGLAQTGIDLIRTSLPADQVRWVVGWSQIRLDLSALGFTLALAAVTAVAFALLPALRSARTDLVGILKTGGRGSAGAPRRRLRGALVGAQVAWCLVLVAGAMLMTRGFVSLVNLYQGFDPEQVVTVRLKLPEWQYPQTRAAAAFYERVLHGLETTPGVESVGVMSHPPADLGPVPRTGFGIEGRAPAQQQQKPSADIQTISAGYLKALRVAVLRGRALTDADGPGAPPAAVVSASLADRFWPGEDPLGRRIRVDGSDGWHEVVGVAADVKQYWFDRDPRPTLYVSYLQSPRRDMFLAVRSPRELDAVVPAVREIIRAADPKQPLDEIRTMGAIVSESASFIRVGAALMGTLGAVALLLAAVGLHAVIAEHAARRTHEIGVRMALGARAADVLRLVLSEAARMAGLGLGVGVVGAFGLGRLMAGALFGVVRPDVFVLLAVALILAAVGLVAAWAPARRATRVDPLLALREE